MKLIHADEYNALLERAEEFNSRFSVGDSITYNNRSVTIKFPASVICDKKVIWVKEIIGPIPLDDIQEYTED